VEIGTRLNVNLRQSCILFLTGFFEGDIEIEPGEEPYGISIRFKEYNYLCILRDMFKTSRCYRDSKKDKVKY
jgi:hypothetical protein